MIDYPVYERLKALAGGRVHFVRMPQQPVLPAVVYTVISSVEEYSGDGHDGLTEWRVQVDCWAATRAEVSALMAQVKSIMRVSSNDFATVDESAGLDEIENETNYHRASVDFICWQHS